MIHGKLKSRLRSLVNAENRLRLRRLWRHLKQGVTQAPKTSAAQMREVIKEMGITLGDKIIVSSSFGHLNAEFTPAELIVMLQEAVGETGLIMMPYYPPINSTEWADKQEVFDMQTTKSGMGILTNVFSKMAGVYMSTHPTKAVCAWGNGAEDIVKDHEKSITPFYWDTPYARLLKMGSKSLGLGLKNIPIFHVFEDVLSDTPFFYYQEKLYSLTVVDKRGHHIVVETRVHDQKVLDQCKPAGDYVRDLACKSYKRKEVGSAFVYVIDNNDLYAKCAEDIKNGNQLRFLRN